MNLQYADGMCRVVQKQVCESFGKTPEDINSFAAPESKRTVRSDGVVYVNDLKYGEAYPNSYLDIWYADESGSARPTVVYFHGGGFLFGDKIAGDPLAVKAGGPVGLMLRIVNEGYNLVSVNYALAPEYRFPAQVIQCNAALIWLRDNASSLDLDMGRIVIMGSSAGANMTLLLGQVIADPQYAKALGVTGTIEKWRVKVLFADESALSVGGMSQNLDMMGMSWIGENDMVSGPMAKLLPVQNHMRGSFFPTFVNASNVEPAFWEEAKHTAAVLETTNTPYELFYRTQEKAGALNHGYVEQFESNSVSKECLERMLSFIAQYITQ